jgi:hypothetical protein
MFHAEPEGLLMKCIKFYTQKESEYRFRIVTTVFQFLQK